MSSPIEKIATGRANYFRLTEDLFDFAEFNPRITFTEIEEMAHSIKEQGIKIACRGRLDVASGRFKLNDGERRLRGLRFAIENLGLDRNSEKALVPVMIEPKGYTDEDRVLDTLTLNTGKPLSVYEQGRAMQKLITEHGYTPESVAQKAGCSVTHVNNCLSLMNGACAALQLAVTEDRIAATTAVDLVKEAPDLERQGELLEEALAAAAESGHDRATAKHFSIPLGKAAQAARAAAEDTTIFERENAELIDKCADLIRSEGAATPALLQRRFQIGYTKSICILELLEERGLIKRTEEPGCHYRLAELCGTGVPPVGGTATEPSHSLEGCATIANKNPQTPFDGKDTGADTPTTDHEGNFVSHITEEPVRFERECYGDIKLVELDAAFYVGWILFWPGKGGWKLVKPRHEEPSYATADEARIAALQAMRAEIELQNFETKDSALEALDKGLEELTAGTPLHKATIFSPHGEAPQDRAEAAGIPNPVIKSGTGSGTGVPPVGSPNEPDKADRKAIAAEIKELLDAIDPKDAEKDRRKTLGKVHQFLAGKIDGVALTRFILGIDK